MRTSAFFRFFAVCVLGGVTGASAIAAAAVAPSVSLSLRGVGDNTIEQGEPLSVSVRVAVPDRSDATIELAPASGTWVGAIAVEITRTTEAPVLARAEPVGQPGSPRITLDPQRAAGGLWMFSSAATRLPPGDYFVRVKLAIDAGAGWRGEVRSTAWPLKIVAVSGAPERIAQRTRARAAEAAAGNKLQEAAAILDAQLKLTPGDRPMLLLRAAIAEQAGNIAAALLCVNLAARGLPGNSPPPAGLPEMQARLRAKMLRAPASDAATIPPAWTWPPDSGLLERAKMSAEAGSRPASVPAATVSPLPSTSGVPQPAPPVAPPAAAKAASAGPKIGAPSAGVIVPAAELDDKKIRADAAGQWAASATASSQYSSPRYAPAQATGVPSVPLGMAGDNPDAWCPGRQNDGTEWLEVAFAKPAAATEVRVLQNNAPGAIAKVEAFEPDGTAHLWWEGTDPYVAPAIREIAWFVVRVPKTDYVVAKVKLTLNLAAVPGWKQIDAVQLFTAP